MLKINMVLIDNISLKEETIW